jgi:hypothetical protein
MFIFVAMSDLWDHEFHTILFWKQEVTKEDFLLELPFEKSVEFNKAMKNYLFWFLGHLQLNSIFEALITLK